MLLCFYRHHQPSATFPEPLFPQPLSLVLCSHTPHPTWTINICRVNDCSVIVTWWQQITKMKKKMKQENLVSRIQGEYHNSHGKKIRENLASLTFRKANICNLNLEYKNTHFPEASLFYEIIHQSSLKQQNLLLCLSTSYLLSDWVGFMCWQMKIRSENVVNKKTIWFIYVYTLKLFPGTYLLCKMNQEYLG